MSQKITQVSIALLASAFLLSGCGVLPSGTPSTEPAGAGEPTVSEAPSEPATEESTTEAPPAEQPPAEEPKAEDPPQEAPAVQAESCGWDSPKIPGSSSDAPSDQSGGLETAIIGAWQHTHIDSGSGYEPVGDGTDIRYVFPSTTRILYCQDVKGATDQAENAADITLDGTKIVLPGSAPGFEVISWSADTMVWNNNLDGSKYLLHRR